MADVAELATDVVADVAEEVAESAQFVADISRNSTGRDLGLVFSGLVIGAGLGATGAFFFFRRRFEDKYNQIAEDEIDAMREHFRQRLIVRDQKPQLSDLAKQHQEIVDEKGYSGEGPPMAVQPPEQTLTPGRFTEVEIKAIEETAAAEAAEREEDRRQAAAEAEIRNVFVEHGEESTPYEDHWNYQEELRRRSPIRPYVIHIDERQETAYQETTFTYYEVDDVLCNERDEIIVKGGERDSLIGEDNLNKFGHGSEDPNVVYIRNDKLELDMEISRSPLSYAEEVQGLDPGDEIQHGDRRRGRPRFDDE